MVNRPEGTIGGDGMFCSIGGGGYRVYTNASNYTLKMEMNK